MYQSMIANISRFLTCETYEKLERNRDALHELSKLLPSGSGFDSGMRILEVTEKKITIECDFHHMDDNGSYCGWSEHIATVKPTFDGFTIKVSGKNVHQIKEYILDTLYNALNVNVIGTYHEEDDSFTFALFNGQY